MRILILTLATYSILINSAYSQCREVKKSLNVLNEDDLDSSIVLLDQAEKLIVENGLESVDNKCLAKYYYTRGITTLMLARKADSLDLKDSLLEKSATYYLSFLKQDQRPEEMLEKVNSNMVSLAVEYGNLGIAYYGKRDFNRAHQYAEKSIDLKMTFDSSKVTNQDYFNAMVCAKMAGQYDKALFYADTLVNQPSLKKPDLLKYLCQKTEVLIAKGEGDSAVTSLKRLKELDSTDVQVQKIELQLLIDQKKNKEALVVVNKLLTKETTDIRLRVLKGQLLQQDRKFEEASAVYQKVLTSSPNNEAALYGLSVINVEKANEAIAQISTSDNIHKASLEEVAKNNFDSSLSYLDRILKTNPNNLEALIAMKKIYESVGNTDKVKEVVARIEKVK